MRAPRRSTLCLFAYVFGLSAYANAAAWVSPEHLDWFPPFQEGVDLLKRNHLGAEYFRIAMALVEGRGFSDPFGAGTGPTAWMPPLYPALLAALIWLLGSKSAVGWAILLLKNLTLVWVGTQVRAVAQRSHLALAPGWAVAAYAVWLAAHFDWFFQFSHDTWLMLLLVTASFVFAVRVLGDEPPRFGRLGWPLAWGLLGGVNALASPIAGLSWATASAFLLVRDPRRLRKLCAAGMLAALCVAPWIARNAVVFDRLILMKSNLYFDLYLANYKSLTGVYDSRFLHVYHPYFHAKKPNSGYRRLGETAYLDTFEERFHRELDARPEVYLRKVGRRLLAVTLLHHPHRPELEGTLPPFRTALHPLPLLGLLATLALRRRRLPAVVGLAATLYAVYLVPYVAAAFYNRYLLPVSALLALFAFWGADAALATRQAPTDRTRDALETDS
ncbi:MAG: hypothetical protein JRG96_13325 [Deltaproteobacteria bacterium]|nr:hypothetical protein [Deltaproteobacteria bacterium]MBW2419451.1 hypothetical protein [Deltaproteobacteria bacterium]